MAEAKCKFQSYAMSMLFIKTFLKQRRHICWWTDCCKSVAMVWHSLVLHKRQGIRSVPLCIITWVKVWKKASSPRHVRIWQPSRKTTKRWGSGKLIFATFISCHCKVQWIFWDRFCIGYCMVIFLQWGSRPPSVATTRNFSACCDHLSTKMMIWGGHWNRGGRRTRRNKKDKNINKYIYIFFLFHFYCYFYIFILFFYFLFFAKEKKRVMEMNSEHFQSKGGEHQMCSSNIQICWRNAWSFLVILHIWATECDSELCMPKKMRRERLFLCICVLLWRA